MIVATIHRNTRSSSSITKIEDMFSVRFNRAAIARTPSHGTLTEPVADKPARFRYCDDVPLRACVQRAEVAVNAEGLFELPPVRTTANTQYGYRYLILLECLFHRR